jgi:uncharacterized protein YcbK (DUF882 family)
MKEVNGYYVWQKGQVFPFNKYFKSSEFDCQCKLKSCVDQKVSIKLINKIVELREAIQEPLTVTSGFRCKAHQAEIRASGVSTVVAKVSTHESGDAADIKPTRTSIKDFETVCARFFMSIGIAKNFLHLDLREGKFRRWDY